MLLYVALHAKRDTKNGRGKYSQLQSDQGFPSYFLYLASLCSIVFSSFMCSFSSSGGGSLDNYTVGSADSAVKPFKKLSANQTYGDHRLPLNFTHSKSYR